MFGARGRRVLWGAVICLGLVVPVGRAAETGTTGTAHHKQVAGGKSPSRPGRGSQVSAASGSGSSSQSSGQDKNPAAPGSQGGGGSLDSLEGAGAGASSSTGAEPGAAAAGSQQQPKEQQQPASRIRTPLPWLAIAAAGVAIALASLFALSMGLWLMARSRQSSKSLAEVKTDLTAFKNNQTVEIHTLEGKLQEAAAESRNLKRSIGGLEIAIRELKKGSGQGAAQGRVAARAEEGYEALPPEEMPPDEPERWPQAGKPILRLDLGQPARGGAPAPPPPVFVGAVADVLARLPDGFRLMAYDNIAALLLDAGSSAGQYRVFADPSTGNPCVLPLAERAAMPKELYALEPVFEVEGTGSGAVNVVAHPRLEPAGGGYRILSKGRLQVG